MTNYKHNIRQILSTFRILRAIARDGFKIKKNHFKMTKTLRTVIYLKCNHVAVGFKIHTYTLIISGPTGLTEVVLRGVIIFWGGAKLFQ